MKHRTIPVFVPELACPNQCIYCNQRIISGQLQIPSDQEIIDTIERNLSTFDSDTFVELGFFGGNFTGIDFDEQQRLFSLIKPYRDKGIIKEVRLSKNLVSYPASLTSAGELSIEMEKVLNAMPNSNEKIKADKILEINAEHKVLEKLKELYQTNKESLKTYAVILYNGARLIEGLAIEDAGEFVKKIAEIL